MSQTQTAVPLVLTDEDRAELARWSDGSSPMLAERARIVLACAEPGSGVARVAAELGATRMTVRKWRRRFAEDGLAGLADHDRPGRPVAELALTGEERDQLTRWARRATTSQALALRAKIVLACAAGAAAVDPAGQGRGGHHRHAGGDAAGRHALVAVLDGRAQRAEQVHDRADLAQVRHQAALNRHVQAVHRPAVRGEGRRCRRPVPPPAGEDGGAVRG